VEYGVLQGAAYQPTTVNGQPGLLLRLGEEPYSILTLDIAGGRIIGIAIIVNPEKLQHLRGDHGSPRG